MIPVKVPNNDLSWYLSLLRNDGACCPSWKSWSGKLYDEGVSWQERRSWREWKKLFLGSSEIRRFCWVPQTWERYEKMISKTQGVDLNRAEPWKYWHQAVHAARRAKKRREKWSRWGKALKGCGLDALLPDVPEALDSDPDVALTEKLFLARYPDILLIKEHIDSLPGGGPAKDSPLESLSRELRQEYETFSGKEIGFEIQRKLEVWTCPYCNSHYLEPRINYKTGRIHPGMQMDHFYPKEKYGILSMSLFNLVPSCSYCNHEKWNSAMEVSVYNENAHAYDVVFRYEPTPPDNVDFLMNKRVSLYLQVNGHEETSPETARNMLADVSGVLHLAQRVEGEQDRVRYNHGLRVVEQLIENARDNPPEKRLLFGEFGKPGLSEQEARQEWYRKVFAKWYGVTDDNFLASPYSKLCSDIIDQLLKADREQDST